MPKNMIFPQVDEFYKDAYNGDKRLIVRIFYRALLDACATTKKAGKHKREAFRWFFRETGEYSAAWWAEVADLDYLFCQCKRAILTKKISKTLRHKLTRML